MLHDPLLIAPSAAFWSEAARALLTSEHLFAGAGGQQCDLSPLRVVVPTFDHERQLQAALARELPGAFFPPRITTLSAWLALLPPDPAPIAAGASERLMALYAELRQHAWLKKLFSARRNTDLLPLAQTLLALCDELTQSLLPELRLEPDAVDRRWRAALGKLTPTASGFLSDEAQLVWSIWNSQLDGSDVDALRFARMMRLAARAEDPLLWVTPTEPDAFDRAFLNAYGKRQTVLPLMLDWRAAGLAPAYGSAWPEMTADHAQAAGIAAPVGLSLSAAASLEQEAVQGAQTVMDWLQAGKSNIAIIAQDRVTARRLRALLERAQVFVADETGWKLSTTRAAAAIDAWFEVVAARAETVALLDFLKSPFVLAGLDAKPSQVMTIELALRGANVPGGWEAVTAALAQWPAAREIVSGIAAQAALYGGRKTLAQWSGLTGATLAAFGMRDALAADAAGLQVSALLESIGHDCGALAQPFSFPEWRAFVSLQLESTPFTAPRIDRRVVMLPLNGAHLRSFDAVLMVGADAAHLPSQPAEALFFANAVRRELGLGTRESRQLQQLRDFAELLSFNHEVVLSWQACKDGEPNPVSAWIERLQLVLERSGSNGIQAHQVCIPTQELTSSAPLMPAPAAPQLRPDKLSASGYNSFVACPYQFFATRMLRLSALDELSDLPQKRDYGGWLHRILHLYHAAMRDRNLEPGAHEPLLRQLSEDIFRQELDRNGAALGYYVRWQKAIPAYLAWADQREAEGWRFVIGEQWYERNLEWTDGAIRLQGRIDRLDENAAGECAVLDYKTNNLPALRDKLKQGEDHQLAFYGVLSERAVTAAQYVALEPVRGKTGDAAAPHFAAWRQMLERQIGIQMQAISRGAALPANGVEAVCQYCEVRGMCRKGAW